MYGIKASVILMAWSPEPMSFMRICKLHGLNNRDSKDAIKIECKCKHL